MEFIAPENSGKCQHMENGKAILDSFNLWKMKKRTKLSFVEGL